MASGNESIFQIKKDTVYIEEEVTVKPDRGTQASSLFRIDVGLQFFFKIILKAVEEICFLKNKLF